MIIFSIQSETQCIQTGYRILTMCIALNIHLFLFFRLCSINLYYDILVLCKILMTILLI